MSWNDLSMKDRASYIKLGIENGITDLDTIRGIYNKFALGGDTKDSSEYIYADSDTTDPNFTDLTPIGEGVYKNKFGKIVYDTTKVTPPKKDKSINDNWQTAYKPIQAVFDKRYVPFINEKRLPEVIAEAESKVNKNFKKVTDFIKKAELEKGYDVNAAQKELADEIFYNGGLDRDPIIRLEGPNPRYGGIYDSRSNEISLVATDPLSSNILLPIDKLNPLAAHEYQHYVQELNPYYKKMVVYDPSSNYYVTNPENKSARTTFFYLDNAEDPWLRSPHEVQSEIARYKYIHNNPRSVSEWPREQQQDLFNFVSDQFEIDKYNAERMVKAMGVAGYAEGGPLKKSYKDFSTRLSKAWGNQDLSQDDYDYQKYYNDDPEEAYRQLESIEKGGQGHFPDEGRSGIYKTSKHPTYPDLGANSWLNNDRIFNMSARQAVPENTDRVLDYLGYDLGYNKGGTKAMYNGAYQLPEVTITPNGNYTELIPNELGTGWMYRNRAGRFDDFNYDYVNRYEGNQKALGGNLFADGGKKATRYRSSSNIRKQISTWEGSTMRTNVPFDRMDTMFNQVLPEGALEKLSQEQLDGLYSFAYNVGTGRFKTRTAPTLAKYLQGNATIEDVKGTMWASGDKKYRGLANRRKKERSMLGAYVPVQETIPMTTPLATPLDITPAVQPIIESNPVIQDNIETLPLAFNTESQKESYYTPGFFDYVNYINQIRQPKQPKQRDRRIWLTI